MKTYVCSAVSFGGMTGGAVRRGKIVQKVYLERRAGCSLDHENAGIMGAYLISNHIGSVGSCQALSTGGEWAVGDGTTR